MNNPFVAPIDEQEYLEFIDTDISFILSKKTWRKAVPIVQKANRILDKGDRIYVFSPEMY